MIVELEEYAMAGKKGVRLGRKPGTYGRTVHPDFGSLRSIHDGRSNKELITS